MATFVSYDCLQFTAVKIRPYSFELISIIASLHSANRLDSKNALLLRCETPCYLRTFFFFLVNC